MVQRDPEDNAPPLGGRATRPTLHRPGVADTRRQWVPGGTKGATTGTPVSCRIPPMFATVVNSGAVVLGTILGLLVGSRLVDEYKQLVFTAVGVVALVIGFSMALETQRFLYMTLSLVLGGLAGTALGIEDWIYSVGESLKRRFGGGPPGKGRRARQEGGAAEPGLAAEANPSGDEIGEGASTHSFAQGFLTATVLFCVGALAIIGSFEAGAQGSYALLLTKSVMDGFMAILLTAAYGIGVGFSALSIFAYQGVLTILASLLRPLVTPLVLSEISGVGGAMVIMIGMNLLNLRRIKTTNFLPGLLVVVLLVFLDPWLGPYVL